MGIFITLITEIKVILFYSIEDGARLGLKRKKRKTLGKMERKGPDTARLKLKRKGMNTTGNREREKEREMSESD